MSPLVVYAALVLILAATVTHPKEHPRNDISPTNTMTQFPPLRQVVQCKCGKVKLSVNAPSALRLVCYSKDYRGYYNTLNDQAKAKGKASHAALDPWGGYVL